MLETLATALAASYVLHPYRGYGRLNYMISRFVGSKITTRQVHDFVFSFDLFDPYWNLLLAKNFIYEPELEAFLRCQLHKNSIFVDCGANYGFWTLFALGRLNDDDCISIEASPETFQHLKRNVELNNRYPRLINRAISSSNDELVRFETSGRNHAGASMAGMKKFESARTTNVRTIDFKRILGAHHTNRSIFIKLDVEGAEIEAIKGLGELADDLDITIIYEEVAKDCLVTKFFLSQKDQKWHICDITPDGATIEIDHQRAKEIASRASGPVNFVATNSLTFSQESVRAEEAG